MIGSPENNFQTMQPPQQTPQPRNVMLGNAMQNMPKQPMQPRQPQATQNPFVSNQNMGVPLGQANVQGLPTSMMSPNQYGNPTPQMGNMQMPQSNAGYNLQPQVPNNMSMPQGPVGMNQQSQNRFGVGLARPMPQNTQVR